MRRNKTSIRDDIDIHSAPTPLAPSINILLEPMFATMHFRRWNMQGFWRLPTLYVLDSSRAKLQKIKLLNWKIKIIQKPQPLVGIRPIKTIYVYFEFSPGMFSDGRFFHRKYMRNIIFQVFLSMSLRFCYIPSMERRTFPPYVDSNSIGGLHSSVLRIFSSF